MDMQEYEKRYNYFVSLFKKYDKIPTLMLDFACGTGILTNMFAKNGVSCIGVDISPEMLDIAKNNSIVAGNDVLYLCQGGSELDLYGTVDGVICSMDSINHIIDEDELQATFDKISLFLERNRLFIFDANTIYKAKYVLADNTFFLESDNVSCVWCNNYYEEDNSTDIYLSFFEQKRNNTYIRTNEEFTERSYPIPLLKQMLKKSGFKVENVFDDLTENTPNRASQRVVFVARKV